MDSEQRSQNGFHFFCDSGANPIIKISRGETALTWAEKVKREAIAEILKAEGDCDALKRKNVKYCAFPVA